jgi:hypothetical protein
MLEVLTDDALRLNSGCPLWTSSAMLRAGSCSARGYAAREATGSALPATGNIESTFSPEERKGSEVRLALFGHSTTYLSLHNRNARTDRCACTFALVLNLPPGGWLLTVMSIAGASTTLVNSSTIEGTFIPIAYTPGYDGVPRCRESPRLFAYSPFVLAVGLRGLDLLLCVESSRFALTTLGGPLLISLDLDGKLWVGSPK